MCVEIASLLLPSEIRLLIPLPTEARQQSIKRGSQREMQEQDRDRDSGTLQLA